MFGMRRLGFEAFPEAGPVLVIAPHVTYLDWLAMLGSMPRPPHILADSFFVFQHRAVAWLAWMAGIVPVHRDRPDPYAVRQFLNLLDEGKLCVLFPEGKRSMEGRALPPMAQAVKLISRLRVPIGVVAFEGLYDAWPRWDRRPRVGYGAIGVRFLGIIRRPEAVARSYDHRAALDATAERERIHGWLRDAAGGEAERLSLVDDRFAELATILCFCPACAMPDGLTREEARFACRRCGGILERSGDRLRLSAGGATRESTLADWFQHMLDRLVATDAANLATEAEAMISEPVSARGPARLRIDGTGVTVSSGGERWRIPLARAVTASIKGRDALQLHRDAVPYTFTGRDGNAATWLILIRKLAGSRELFSEL
jgi:1-acyl-sn-glycerol-3-phosphate acyltransferase